MGRFSTIVAYLLLVFGGGCTLVALPYVSESLTYLNDSSGSYESKLATMIGIYAGGLWLVGGLLPLLAGFLMLRRKQRKSG